MNFDPEHNVQPTPVSVIHAGVSLGVELSCKEVYNEGIYALTLTLKG